MADGGDALRARKVAQAKSFAETLDREVKEEAASKVQSVIRRQQSEKKTMDVKQRELAGPSRQATPAEKAAEAQAARVEAALRVAASEASSVRAAIPMASGASEGPSGAARAAAAEIETEIEAALRQADEAEAAANEADEASAAVAEAAAFAAEEDEAAAFAAQAAEWEEVDDDPTEPPPAAAAYTPYPPKAANSSSSSSSSSSKTASSSFQQEAVKSELDKMSVKQLKAIALAYSVDISRCSEKGEIVAELKRHGISAASSEPPPPPKQGQDKAQAPKPSAQNTAQNTAGGASGGGASSGAQSGAPGGPSKDEKASEKASAKASADARLHSERAAKLIQEEVKRMEPTHALSGALGGAAILVGGSVGAAGLVVVLPAVAGYYKGLPAALSVLLGVSVTVVFVETGVVMFSVAHMLNGVLNTPKTAIMLAQGYEYDEVELAWVDPSDGAVVGGAAYALAHEAAAIKALADKDSKDKKDGDKGEAEAASEAKNEDAAAPAKAKKSGDGFANAKGSRGVDGRKVADPKLYDALEVPCAASQADIKKAYYKAARKYHPDKNPGDAKAAAKFIEVGTAFQVLSNDKARRDYDHSGPSESKGGANGGQGVDPATMFTMMFGAEQFEPYIGVLAAATLAEQVTQPPSAEEEARAAKAAARAAAAGARRVKRAAVAAARGEPFDPSERDSGDERDAAEEAKEMAEQLAGGSKDSGAGSSYRIQRRREVTLAQELLARTQPYVDAVTKPKPAGDGGGGGGDDDDDQGADEEKEGGGGDAGLSAGAAAAAKAAAKEAARKERLVMAWLEVMQSDANSLADAPFGERLLEGVAWAYDNAARRWAPVPSSPAFHSAQAKQRADAAAAAATAAPAALAAKPLSSLGLGRPSAVQKGVEAVPVVGAALGSAVSTVGGKAGGLTGYLEGSVRHVQRYLGLADGLASIIGVASSADMADPLSGEKVQESAFELLAKHTLMDVETTCLASCKRLLTDSGAGHQADGTAGSGAQGSGNVVVAMVGALYSGASMVASAASGMASAAASAAGLTGGDPAKPDPELPASNGDVLRARGEALLLLAHCYSRARSTNPDPYSWREAFAAAASGSSR